MLCKLNPYLPFYIYKTLFCMFVHIQRIRHSSHLPILAHSSLHCGLVDGKNLRLLKVINEMLPCELLIHPGQGKHTFQSCQLHD